MTTYVLLLVLHHAAGMLDGLIYNAHAADDAKRYADAGNNADCWDTYDGMSLHQSSPAAPLLLLLLMMNPSMLLMRYQCRSCRYLL